MANCFDLLVTIAINIGCLIAPFLYAPVFFPINCLYNYFTMYNPHCCQAENTPEKHSQKVDRVQAQLQRWNSEGRKKKLCSARSTRKMFSFRAMDKSRYTQIQIGDLDEIVEVDLQNMVVRVEPGMLMGTLTHKLLPLGVIIPVIPEFELLTVGGLINSSGIESSSGRHGLFSATCLEFEMVLADGTVCVCSKDQHPDLFYAIPMAHGTLGFMMSATFPLIKAGKYVRLEYHKANSIKEADSLIRNTQFHIVEALAYSKDKFVVMHGDFADKAEPGKVNHINRGYKNWFYRHAQTFLNKRNVGVEYIPSRDYFHRHTRSYFWCVTVPWLTRTRVWIFLFGWLLPFNFTLLRTIFPYPAGVVSFGTKFFILQDFMVPMDKLEEAITLSDELTGVYPLWICRIKFFQRPGFVRCIGNTDTDYFDIGIYGWVKGDKRKKLGGDANEAVKQFEQYSIKNTGLQMFYTDSFLTRADFDKMFDRTLYDRMRTELNCHDAFPDVYDKITVANRTA